MAAEEIDNFESQAPPSKRIRLATSQGCESSASMDDMDNSYQRYQAHAGISAMQASAENNTNPGTPPVAHFGIPGLGRLVHAPKAAEEAAELYTQPEGVHDRTYMSSDITGQSGAVMADNGVPQIDDEMPDAPQDTSYLPTPSAISAALEAPVSITTIPPSSKELTQIPIEPIMTNEGSSEANSDVVGTTVVGSTAKPPNPVLSESKTLDYHTDKDQMETESEMASINTALGQSLTDAKQVFDGEQALLKPESAPLEATDRATLDINAPIQEEVVEAAPSPPLTHALEALLGGLDAPIVVREQALVSEALPPVEGGGTEEEHPEWEIDSSPIESSSDDSSSDDSSSEDSDDDGNAYKLLTPEEQARILMEGDGGSDDEGGASKGAKGSGGQLRTKNEVPEEVIPRPEVTITPEMSIQELGEVEAIVESILLIKAKTSGEYRVLESGSVLCLGDRAVIGVVSETLGRVQQPLYSVRFTNSSEIAEAGLLVGTKVFYSEQHSTYVFTQALKSYKGSDASNLHDEEVGDEEIEFSDDEAEMEHKRRLKQKRVERRGGKVQQGGSTRGGHPLQQEHKPYDAAVGISYDDADDDGPYKPLARPVGYAGVVARGEPPQEGPYSLGNDRTSHGGRGPGNMNDQHRERGRGDRDRGQGSRGRGSDRGRGRRGYQDHRSSHGYSQPPQGRPNNGYAQPQQNPGGSFPQSPMQMLMPMPQGREYLQSPQGSPVPPPNNYYMSPQDQYSPQQPQIWPPFQPQQPYQQQAYQQPNQNAANVWKNGPPAASLPTGAFINPAFFNGNQLAASTNGTNQASRADKVVGVLDDESPTDTCRLNTI